MADKDYLLLLKKGVATWNAWRRSNPLVEIDLKKADLSTLDLQNAELENVNLQEANLRGSSLHYAILQGADLRGASLVDAFMVRAKLENALARGADLAGVDASYASFKAADLSHASLQKTVFSQTDLRNADLTAAICNGTIFSDVNLSLVKGLETIDHQGPSSISVDTLLRNEVDLPEIFLRGCGVPEILIEYLPYMLNNAIEFYSCFISYSHEDKVFARRVHDTLQGRGIRCWLDEKQINPGDVIEDEIYRGIRYSDKLLLCCSEKSLSSWWVDNELDNLFAKERELQAERGQQYRLLIPLDIDGYLHSDVYRSGKKEQIRKRFAPSFKHWEHDNAIFEREIERVIKALRTDGGKEPPPKPKL